MYAALSAGFFWNTHKLNILADNQDIKMMTKRINGGFIGLADREKHYQQALAVLNT
jgi:putative chitinase